MKKEKRKKKYLETALSSPRKRTKEKNVFLHPHRGGERRRKREGDERMMKGRKRGGETERKKETGEERGKEKRKGKDNAFAFPPCLLATRQPFRVRRHIPQFRVKLFRIFSYRSGCAFT